MTPMKTTPELFDAVKHALTVTGLTSEEIDDRDGPSSTTMTKLRGRTLEVTSEKTLRGLSKAFGWPLQDTLDLVDSRTTVRRGALTRLTVGGSGQGGSHGRRSRRGKANQVQVQAMRDYIEQQQKALAELLEKLEAAEDD